MVKLICTLLLLLLLLVLPRRLLLLVARRAQPAFVARLSGTQSAQLLWRANVTRSAPTTMLADSSPTALLAPIALTAVLAD